MTNAIKNAVSNMQAGKEAQRKPRRTRAAWGGAALLALSALFNQAALGDEPALPAPMPENMAPINQGQAAIQNDEQASDNVTQNQESQDIQDPQDLQNQAMVDALAAIEAQIQKRNTNDSFYEPQKDPEILAMIDDLIVVMQNGADGNFFPGTDGLDIFDMKNLSAFTAAMALAVETGRLDLVDAFIDAGADVKQVAADQWTPMDYAISFFLQAQSISRETAERAFALLQRIEAAGAQLSDAKEIGKAFTPPGSGPLIFNSYGMLASNMLAVMVMEEAGVTVSLTMGRQSLELQAKPRLFGAPETAEDLSDETRLRRGFIEQNGGDLIHEAYSDAYPGGASIYRVYSGDTLANIATRFYEAMGEKSPLHALASLMRTNDLRADTPLRPGRHILIPVPPTLHIGWVQFRADQTLGAIADLLINNDMLPRPGADRDDVIAELARANNITGADVSEDFVVEKGQRFALLMANDTYRHLPILTPPTDRDLARRVDLVIIEEQSGEDEHRRQTYGAALSANYAINRNVDILRFFAWREHFISYPPGVADLLRGTANSNALLGLMTNPHNPLRDNLVFSQSMEISFGDPRGSRPKPTIMNQVWQDRDIWGPDLADMRIALDILEEAAPITFVAAGNQFANGEGPFKQSYALVHAPRTYVIGAAGRYPVFINGQMEPAYVMSSYSTAGADICAPLPTAQFKQMEGTSFSTPLTAGVFRQMNEWYGHRLSTEEIMAAALMSADRNVLDYDDPIAAGAGRLPAQYRAHMAVFETNGVGLPHHHRCGAGILNVTQWQVMLDRMMELKTSPALDSSQDFETRQYKQTVRLGAPVARPDYTEKGPYVYHVTVPHAMTAGKFTFVIPQHKGAHGDVRVRMPSGYTGLLPRTLTDAVSSHAFAYEDLEAGAVIEIISEYELGPSAEMTMRGFTGRNVVAQLRDELRASGVLPAPLSKIGGQEASLPLPVAPTNIPDIIAPIEGREDDAQPLNMSVDPLAPGQEEEAPEQEEEAPKQGEERPVPQAEVIKSPHRRIKPPAP